MTDIHGKKSESVRKVRLKTARGVLTLCYRSSQSPSREGDHTSSERSSVQKVSHEGIQEPAITNEPNFGSLPELFDVQAQFPILEGPESAAPNSLLMDLPPDFSTYNFWESESGLGLSNAVIGLSDTLSYDEIMLEQPPAVLNSIMEEVKDRPNYEYFQNSAAKFDLPQSQNSINNSCVAEDITSRKRCWDLPTLELEEDIFDTMNWNLLKEFADDERDTERERGIVDRSIVDNYFADRSPPQPSNVDSNVEKLESDNVLVYAPNRYLDKDASCIFQSSLADLEIGKPDVSWRTIDDGRTMQVFQKDSSYRKKERKNDSERREKNRPKEDRQSTEVEYRNAHTSSWMEVCKALDVMTARSVPSNTENGENPHTPRMQHLNRRRRRFSAPGIKRSKFVKPSSTLTSLDSQRSPKITQAGRRSTRGRLTPARNTDTVVRLLKPKYCLNSPKSGGESDHDCHETPRKTTPPRQFAMPCDDEHKRLRRRLDISLHESYAASGPWNATPNQSNSREEALNACLLRKKRTRYTDVCLKGANDTSEIETRLDTSSENHSPAHSPTIGKLFTASPTPRSSPAIGQQRKSPWDGNRRKVRTFRGRASRSSPDKSAKKLHFYSKIIHGGGSGSGNRAQQETPSPAPTAISAGTNFAEKRGRRRLPLPQRSVEILQRWLHDNLLDPYPSRQQKEELLFQTGLKLSQVDNWLGNARQKLKLKSRAMKDLSESSSSPEPKKRSKRKRSYPLKLKI